MRWLELARQQPGPLFPAAIWRLELGAWPAENEIAWLSPAERRRAERFVFDGDRRRYLAAHCALRGLLARHTRRDAAALEFEVGPHGKPSLAGAPTCQFNLTHGDEVALVAIGDGAAIGVDVEILRPIEDAAELAELHFTPAEQAEWHAAGVQERDRLFLSGWTRKEACLKAIGSGLSLAANRVEAGLAPELRDLSVDTGSGRLALTVQTIDAGSDVVAAVACLKETAA